MATVTPGDCPHALERARVRRRRVEGKARKNFPCQLCEKAFNSVEKLKVHSYSHTGERPFRCTHADCTKAFVSKYKLLRHMATHSPEKTHKCTYCEKMFHRKDHLKNHLHTHDPNKESFTCDECGKSYNTKLGYKRHLALHAAHSGDLTCQVCLQSYPSTPLLLEHLRAHAGKSSSAAAKEKRHQCEHCERRFYTRKDVRRHMVVHTGRKDFLCQYCAQRFGRKDHLTRHVKKSHAPELLLAVKAEPVELEPIGCQVPGALGDVTVGTVKDELAVLGGMFGPSPPLTLRYPLGPASYSPPPPLRADLETYLLELQSHLPSESSPAATSDDTGLLKVGGVGGTSIATVTTGDALGSSSSSSLEFSQLFNFLPLNGPCYGQVGAAGSALGLGVSYPPEEGLSLAPSGPQDPLGPVEPASPLHPISTYPPSLSTHTHTPTHTHTHSASLSTATTLPRFHQAFQ